MITFRIKLQQINSQLIQPYLIDQFNQFDITLHCIYNCIYTSHKDEMNIEYLHYHFPNLSPQNFRLFKTQRDISMNLQERINNYKKQIEDVKVALKRQSLAFEKINIQLHDKDYILNIKNSLAALKISKQNDENNKDPQAQICQKRQQIDQLQFQYQKKQLELQLSKFELQYVETSLQCLENLKVQIQQNELSEQSLKRNRLQEQLDSLNVFIQQNQKNQIQEKDKCMEMIHQLQNDGINIHQGEKDKVQNLLLDQLFVQLNAQIYESKKEFNHLQNDFKIQIANYREIAGNKLEHREYKLLKSRFQQVKDQQIDYYNRINNLKNQCARLQSSFQSDILQVCESSRKQLQKRKIIQMKSYKGVGIKLISMCKGLNMTDISDQFQQRLIQIDNELNLIH